MKSSRLIILILLSCAILPISAQNRKGPRPEDMHEKKWEYIAQTAQLTQDEIKAIKPIFMEYEENIWKLHDQKHMQRRKKDEPIDYKQLNDSYIETEVKQAEYLQAYHKKMQNILSPERLFNYYRAEHSFKRKLVYEMQENHHRKEKNHSYQKK